MSFFESLLSDNSIISPIEQQGNFFIMDSEQLVSKPFQEMQNEAMDQNKKASLTERLVSVKNNVCEKHFLIKAGKLEREMAHNMKKIHDNSSNLRYEVKLYDINKRKIDLETKRRIQPQKDFSYDDSQIKNSEKRLGVVQDSFYLDRKQKFPIRGRSMNDLNATPVVSKARNMLKQQEKEDREDERSTTRFGLSSTPGATSVTSSNRGPLWQRRNSKSAPPLKTSASVNGTLHSRGADSKLPLIDRQKTHVKFTLDESTIRTSTPERLTKSHSYVSSHLTRRSSAWDSSDEEDNDDFMDRINLRALLFGSETKTTGTPRTLTRESSGTIPSMRRGQGPKLTQEMLMQEQKKINKKIHKFYETLRDEDFSSDDDEEIIVQQQQPEKPAPKPVQLSKAAALLSIISKPTEKVENPFIAGQSKGKDDKTLIKADKKAESVSSTPTVASLNKDNKENKNMWEFIRTNMSNGKIKRSTTPSQIILQQMTRLDLSQNEKTRIPLNSASRALRHTPTFKMRKVVEKLMKSRTKFQQQEVDILRQQLEAESLQDNKNQSLEAAA